MHQGPVTLTTATLATVQGNYSVDVVRTLRCLCTQFPPSLCILVDGVELHPFSPKTRLLLAIWQVIKHFWATITWTAQSCDAPVLFSEIFNHPSPHPDTSQEFITSIGIETYRHAKRYVAGLWVINEKGIDTAIFESCVKAEKSGPAVVGYIIQAIHQYPPQVAPSAVG